MSRTSWARIAVAAWAILLVVVCIKPLVKPVSGTVYPTFAHAGEEFAAGRRLYDVPAPYTDNFRYSPLVAAGFAPLALLPLGVGGLVWRAVGAAVYLTGLAAWAYRVRPGAPLAAVFLLALPLSLGSLHNGQANTLVLGLMLWGTVLAAGGRWTAAAVLIAGAVLFKGYPLALGLLLVLAAPARFGVPLAAAVAAGLALPYAFQSAEYVSAQYQFWATNLGRDDRTGFPLHAGYQDVHMLLRVVGVTVPLELYRVVQAAAGGVAAAVIARQMWTGVDRRPVVLNAFTLGVCWMTLFGPSTETATFILMAPLMARELTARAGRPLWARWAATGGACLFVLTRILLAFPHTVHQPVIALGMQPLAAVLLAVASVGRVLATRPGADPVHPVVDDVPLRRAA
ncbi:MAG: hypothetical protein JWO38_762 [Gemmataceae bacterium]|nr:hypothetical protein [Gemmataceae bacterium]